VIHAIPTLYAGVRFRSRLEARWAAFFDIVGWRWEYEPFDYAGYIPDFAILGKIPLLVDVKPATTAPELWARVRVLAPLVREWRHDVLVLGASPTIPLYGYEWSGELDEFADGTRCKYPGRYEDQWALGLLGELSYWRDDEEFSDDDETHCYSHAVCARCPDCEGFAVAHKYQSYARRPCGYYDGSTYPEADPRGAWAAATNAVQWKGRNA